MVTHAGPRPVRVLLRQLVLVVTEAKQDADDVPLRALERVVGVELVVRTKLRDLLRAEDEVKQLPGGTSLPSM